jgi:hypothetical protein
MTETTLILADWELRVRLKVETGRPDCAAELVMAWLTSDEEGQLATPPLKLALDQVAELAWMLTDYLVEADWADDSVLRMGDQIERLMDGLRDLRDKYGMGEDDDNEEDEQ